MGVIEVVRSANLPGPAEDSLLFRAAATLSVAVAVAACWSERELTTVFASSAIGLILVGNAFSYWRRRHPFPFLKLLLAFTVVVSFGWFFVKVSHTASAGDIATVEGPLAILFAVIQASHAFDVPSRRDLAFSLAGSATLMAVAAAQAVDERFAIYVVLWAITGLVGLLALWTSMAGGARVRVRSIGFVGLAVVVLGVAVVIVLPAPNANSSFVLPSSIAGDLPISTPAGLVGGGPNGTQPLQAASDAGRTGVGGFLGFAGPLTTAIRTSLSSEIVFRVRADRPSYWIAETFDHWDGQAWTEETPASTPRVPAKVRPVNNAQWLQLPSGEPFNVPLTLEQGVNGTNDYQTFYLAQSGPNLIFHADNASSVWFPAPHLFVGKGGTLRSSTSLGAGSIYTVLSLISHPAATQLEHPTTTRAKLPSVVRIADLELPGPVPRIRHLARGITRGIHTTFAKIQALEGWMGQHTKYTLTIPPLEKGQNTVDEFLFHTRRGYCEQISTSLVVMLRSLGIPAREAAGYVPGTFDPITDLYQEQAKDAHSWVQVWFPGYGWQSFDPTAVVPLANPTPGSIIEHDIVAAIKKIPLAIAGGALLIVLLLVFLFQYHRRRPSSWEGAITRQLELTALRIGIEPHPTEALTSFAERLESEGVPITATTHSPSQLARLTEASAFGGHVIAKSDRRAMLRSARHIRRTTPKRKPPKAPHEPQHARHT